MLNLSQHFDQFFPTVQQNKSTKDELEWVLQPATPVTTYLLNNISDSEKLSRLLANKQQFLLYSLCCSVSVLKHKTDNFSVKTRKILTCMRFASWNRKHLHAFFPLKCNKRVCRQRQESLFQVRSTNIFPRIIVIPVHNGYEVMKKVHSTDYNTQQACL